VHDGGANAIGPGAAVEQPRCGEGAAAQLLGVEAKRSLLGSVLADGEAAWMSFGSKLVSEAGEVLEIGHCVPLGEDMSGREAPRRAKKASLRHRSLTENRCLVL